MAAARRMSMVGTALRTGTKVIKVTLNVPQFVGARQAGLSVFQDLVIYWDFPT